MAFDRARLQRSAAHLAARGVFVGTSSWKYEGWLGQVYSPERYEYRGKVARTRFQRDCLAEYAETFKTVCVDAAYYTFPSRSQLEGMASQVPADFLFGFKVTDEITVRTFPKLQRFGERGGRINENFLNADLFERAFLNPLNGIRAHVGLLIFEFSRFYPRDYARGTDFVADLDRFLGSLPGGWPYGIELRNHHWLRADYFDCLAKHRVTHVFNSWDAMPPVGEQMAMPRSRTHPELVGARFLLTPGRRYAGAVKKFEPYDRVQEKDPDARAAGRALVSEGLRRDAKCRTFIYVNNRLEGNAPGTLEAMVTDGDEE